MAKQKEQFTEVSDEDLKNVNGGINAAFSMPLFFGNGVQSGDLAAGIGGGACPDSEKDKFGKCPQINIVTN